ncbi:MAG: oleate hydratase [Ignavibacteria bacterium]|nr:oleate hydratase [Ignavibacteria bacterium]
MDTDEGFKNTVTVIGGGIAGLSSAVFLAERGFKVTLYEASPKLGGRAYSFVDNTIGAVLDNGQHILASWYENTFDYLKIIGSFDKLSFQNQLEVNFADQNGMIYRFKCPKLPPPLHLLAGIMKFKALGSKDKLALIRLVRFIKNKKLTRDKLSELNTDKLFSMTGQTERLIENFWKPFIVAVFNASPDNTSALLFADMIRKGFLEKGGSNLVLPNDNLTDIFVKPAEEFLKSKNCEVIFKKRIAKIIIEGNIITSLLDEDNREIKSSFYISAVPFFEFEKLFVNELYHGGLETSPIVNIHLKFDKDIDEIFSERFVGLLGSEVQWAFKVKSDQLCLVISAARKIAEMSKEQIIDLAVNELHYAFPRLKSAKITGSRVIKEMKATFIPNSHSISARPISKTVIKNLFIAGDWADTGLPATIEGAIKSSKTCVNELLKSI